MPNFALSVRFTLKPGSAEGFDALVAATAAGIAAHEPGTLVYVCHTVDGEPDQRIFYELYADRAAFEAHERQEHTRRFLDERGQFIAKTEVDFLQPYSGKHPTEAPSD